MEQNISDETADEPIATQTRVPDEDEEEGVIAIPTRVA